LPPGAVNIFLLNRPQYNLHSGFWFRFHQKSRLWIIIIARLSHQPLQSALRGSQTCVHRPGSSLRGPAARRFKRHSAIYVRPDPLSTDTDGLAS
jgi:hypothetical protein